MQKKLNFLILTIFSFLALITNIKAIDETICNYDDIGLEIHYHKGTNEFRYIFNYEGKTYDTNYSNTDNKHNFLIAKWGKSVDADIELDRSVMKTLVEENLCPTGFYMGFYSKWSLEGPSIKEFLSFFDVFKSGNLDKWKNSGASLLNFGDGNLFIVSTETYKKKYAKYEGDLYIDYLNHSVFENEVDKHDTFLGKIWGGIVGKGKQLYKDVKDLTFGDGLDIVSVETVDLIGVVDYDGPNDTFSVDCPDLDLSLKSYKNLINEYKKCTNGECLSKIKNDVLKMDDSIKSICNSTVRNKNYFGAEKSCVKSCLEIDELLNSYKIDTDLYKEYAYVGKCGFSDKLLAWIMNIMRWIKYLVPILLIVLSIMDFIKALSSDKEDEMKKAQKHFVTRLIVAALIFIAPLIIEFILDKMGFGIENCGINNIGLGK